MSEGPSGWQIIGYGFLFGLGWGFAEVLWAAVRLYLLGMTRRR